MTTLVPIPAHLTLEAFLALPETKPAREYSNDQILEKPMPQGQHSRLQSKLAAVINLQGEPPKIALALTELRCTVGGRSLVPDMAVFTWDRIPKDARGRIANRFLSAPDWVIEILSPEQNTSLVIEKIIFLLEQGTTLGWLIDPDEALILVFQPNQSLRIYRHDQVLPVIPALTGLMLTTQQLLEWLDLG